MKGGMGSKNSKNCKLEIQQLGEKWREDSEEKSKDWNNTTEKGKKDIREVTT